MTRLLLAPDLFTTDSGIPRILRLYLKALGDLATEDKGVRFVSLNDTQIDSNDLRRYTTARLGQWESCSRDKRTFVKAALRLSSGASEILCGHVAQAPVAWAASWLRPGLRYFIIAHGIEVWRPFTFLERRALKRAHRILCVSDFTRREILKHCPLPDERLIVVPNALDPHLDAVQSAPGGRATTKRIITVSRLSKADNYKGVDHLIQALPAILARDPDARLRIVGRGDDSSRLQNLARSTGVGAAVEFAGFVPDGTLAKELAAANVFALPSLKEGFGLVYLEAMAQGVPCLGARAGGTPEVIDDSCGRLVPYGDVAAIATNITEMLSTPWDSAAIRERALTRFGFPAFSAQLAQALRA